MEMIVEYVLPCSFMFFFLAWSSCKCHPFFRIGQNTFGFAVATFDTSLCCITAGKDEIQFAYNETEKAEILSKLEGKKYTIQRSKGLGENEPDMMWQTTMNPETRRLIQVSPADEYETQKMFETLLGDDIAARKAFIAENGARYMDLADI